MFNVILITIDSLRADHVGCISGMTAPVESLTPNLDEWAKDGIVFASAISQSSHTSPSFLSILSGCYPNRYGDWFSSFSKDRTSISVLLAKNGYNTCAINSNPYISSAFGFNRGFAFFEDNVSQVKSTSALRRKMDLWRVRLRTFLREPYAAAEKINRQVIEWKQDAVQPFFLWTHYMDVHGPYLYRRGFKNRIIDGHLWHKALAKPEKIRPKEKASLIKAYREKVKYMDYQAKLLLDTIDSDNTVVIITADHGDLFGEHGHFGHPLHLYEGLLHVPLLMKLPRPSEWTGKRIERQVRSMDLIPTIMDVLGFDAIVCSDGESLLPLIEGQEEGYSCEHIISEVSRSHVSVRKPPWKLIVDYGKDLKQLFNLEHDLNEENNLADEEKAVLGELEEVIQAHIRKHKPQHIDRGTSEIDEVVKARLRALGYMDEDSPG